MLSEKHLLKKQYLDQKKQTHLPLKKKNHTNLSILYMKFFNMQTTLPISNLSLNKI